MTVAIDKSRALGKLCGWYISDGFLRHADGKVLWGNTFGGCTYGENDSDDEWPNLYDQIDMYLLSKVIEWACENMDSIHGMDPNIYFDTFFNPADFHGSMIRMADDILAEAA